jgi:uncharacterized protein (DUF1501 family)
MRPTDSPFSSEGRCRGPISRREILRAGLTGIATLGLSDLLQLRAAAAPPEHARPDTAVILVWLHGGPSHLETYDPKPDAPAEYRGPYKAISTNVPGIRISELLPRQARIADKYALIRSIHHRGICHQQGLQTVLTGHEELTLKPKPDHPDAFCILNKLREGSGKTLPNYISLPSLPYSGAGYLGLGYEQFVVSGDPNDPKFTVPGIGLKDPRAQQRVHRRLQMMEQLDEARRYLEAVPTAAARGKFYEQAVDLVTSTQAAEAFDLSKEDEKLRDRYGRNRWGQQCLLARRLVEAGVGAVTVSFFGIEKGMSGNWDDHAVNWDVFKAMAERAPHFDQAVTALIEDVYARGLDKKIMILVTGEFGRTPRISYTDGRAGRDHWPHAMSVLASGGSLRTGQVIGTTDTRGEYPDERPLSPNDLLATLYRHLGIDPTQVFMDALGRPVPILDRTEPIPELV